jgi:PIN domain nuclease of toxin-antitoxin system
MLNLDTHVFLDAARNNLNSGELSLLQRVPRWGISGIVLWEIEMLYRIGRTNHGLDDPEIRAMLETGTVWPLDANVCLALRRLDFKSDPADELIAATTLARRVPLVTRDGRLRGSALLQRQGLLA